MLCPMGGEVALVLSNRAWYVQNFQRGFCVWAAAWALSASHQARNEEAKGDRGFTAEEMKCKSTDVLADLCPFTLSLKLTSENLSTIFTSVKRPPSAYFKYLTAPHLKTEYSTLCLQINWTVGAASLLSVKRSISSVSLTHVKVTPAWHTADPAAFCKLSI